MKAFFVFSFLVALSLTAHGQDMSAGAQDTINIEPNTLRVVAEVKSADEKMAVLKIQTVLGRGRGTISTLNTGDEVTVRLPGQKVPEVKSIIEADLKEKMDVGALPSSYILTSFRTAE